MSYLKYFLLVLTVSFLACNSQKKEGETVKTPVVETKVKHPEWSKNAVIYEVNIRQYTHEGTFKAFTEQIPRLKNLGIDILWIMPIHPIGVKNRKGTLGSYYSVQNYKAVNPNFGTLDDFKALVNKAHELGMHVIIDWVANHTAWDNPWMTEHPDWYAKDSTGNFYSPFDWTDVVKLDYNNADMESAMINALEYWVKETTIDGYRCDVAGEVPVSFWEKARKALDEIKPVLMLAENENEPKLLENAFDMNYSWSVHHLMNMLAQGKASLKDIKETYVIEDSIYSKDCYRMQFITNHDENSWNGTEFERLGDGVKTFAVMYFTIPGMPLLYTGQEIGMNKRLSFFEKDEISNTHKEYFDFYKSLISLKHDNQLFWNGAAGGDFEILDIASDSVLAFKRSTSMKDAFVILNLTGNPQKYTTPSGMAGAYTDYFAGDSKVMDEGDENTLSPWEYEIYLEK